MRRICTLLRTVVAGTLLATLAAGTTASAEDPCQAGSRAFELSKETRLPEFVIQRHGAVTRHGTAGKRNTFIIEGPEGGTYRVKVEGIPYKKQDKPKLLACASVDANRAYELPQDVDTDPEIKLQAPDFLLISVYGGYIEAEDEAPVAAARTRHLAAMKGQVESVEKTWALYANAFMLVRYPRESLKEAGSPRFGELTLLLEDALKPGGECEKARFAHERGICDVLQKVSAQLVLSNPKDFDAAYANLFKELPDASKKEEFCKQAREVHAIETLSKHGELLFSVNELPLTSVNDTFELTLGGSERSYGSNPGERVVAWVHRVPVDKRPKVAWAVDETKPAGELAPLTRFASSLISWVLNPKTPVLFRDDSALLAAHLPLGGALRDEFLRLANERPHLLVSVVDNACGLTGKVDLPPIASQAARIQVGEPLRGNTKYALSACANEGCLEKEAAKDLLAKATVRTRSDSWRLTLAIGFSGDVRLGSSQFESWRWRPVGSTTGTEQLHEYTHVQDPLSHASASLLLALMSPVYWKGFKPGVAVGPSLLIGKELQPLRQWNLTGVLGLEQGLFFTLGLGVRFEDLPRDPTRAGERRVVAKGAALPDMDTRRGAAPVVSLGFALDTAAIGDAANSLLGSLGVTK